ncbi:MULTISPECIES: hypothetical protein [unclassified Haladaptatus]|uniref:hypothetical protein n=1 Tax=unclassified Haladaptatus TaxID=2622732 RepID=UPI0023E85203|nr:MULTISPECIES: hypothetical protein [unclassified Haladaptatus]
MTTRDTNHTADTTHESNDSHTKLGRRTFLGAVGATAAGASLLATGTARAHDHWDDDYDRVIDMVEDAGADNTGNESITPKLEQYAANDTLLKFPPGRYFMDSQFRFTDFRHFGMMGDDATLVPANYHNFDGPQYRLFRLGVDYDPGVDLRIQGFDVDLRADDTGIRVIEAQVKDGLFVDDITVVGQHDSGTYGPGLFNVLDPDGKGMVKRFRANYGGAFSANTPGDIWRGPSGLMTTRQHKGQIEYKDCELDDWPDNGLYALTNGRVIVNGGRYANSEAASIRLGGTNNLVTGARIVVNKQRPENQNQRGIRLDEGPGNAVVNTDIILDRPNGHAITVMNDCEDAYLRNLDIRIGNEINHGIVVQSKAGPTKILRSDININRGGNAIQINGDNAGKVHCEYLDITGEADGDSWRHAIRCNRNDCEFRVVNVNQQGTNKRRAIVINGNDNLVYRGKQTATHIPIVVNGEGTWIERIDSQSSEDQRAAKLNDQSSNVTLKHSHIKRGIWDKGCDGLRMYGNDTS